MLRQNTQIYEDSQINHPEVYIESLVDDFNPTIVFISSRTTATVVSLLEDIKMYINSSFILKLLQISLNLILKDWLNHFIISKIITLYTCFPLLH